MTAIDTIETYIKKEMRRLKIPAISLAIIEGDQIVHCQGFGMAGPDNASPTAQTPFFIGSLTKSFTALAIMQLVERGEIVLDAPLQSYLPWFMLSDPQASGRITVRHLLNQTSGLPSKAGEIFLADFDRSPHAAERQMRKLPEFQLSHPVGTAFEYSNSNYNLLGLVIESVSGESYANYIQTHILDPLAMCHSYTSPERVQDYGLALGHQFWFAAPIPAPNLPLPHGSLAGGLLISCAEDMARYLSVYLNGGRYFEEQIISRSGIQILQHGVAEFTAMGSSIGKYGMGWFESEIEGEKIIWHSGTLPNFGAYMALLPEQKKGLVLLFNANHHWMNPVLIEFGAGAAAILANKPFRPVPIVRQFPWILRGLLLLPIFQIFDILFTIYLYRKWRNAPEKRPKCSKRTLTLNIILPLIPNLLIASTVKSQFGRRRGYLRLYMPDYFTLSLVSGSLAVVWSFLRTRINLKALRG